jgi:hypothetical protein
MPGSWYPRFTRFMTAHVVHQQEQVNSCGIACILRVNFKMKKGLMFAGLAAGSAVSVVPVPGTSLVGITLSRAAIGMAVKTEPQVYKIYGDVIGTVYDGTSYTDAKQHPDVLNRLGLGNWECFWAGPDGIAQAIQAQVKAGAPCIVHVQWKSGGGHFVCIDEVHAPFGTPYACVNDPGNGEVVETELSGSPISYRNNTGTFSGWIVRRVSAP